MIKYLVDWWRAKHTGFIPQEEDERDHTISGSSEEVVLPDKFSLRYRLGKVRNQKSSEACTGFAVAGLIEALMYKYYGKKAKSISPLYLWYNAKLRHGWAEENKGVWLRYSLTELYKKGYVLEHNMPFRPLYTREPSPGNDSLGEFTKWYLRGTEYVLLNPFQVREKLIKDELPVVFGTRLNNSFYGNKTGIIKDVEPNQYGHAMLVTGFDNVKRLYEVRNSWGAGWGDAGYCYIPYDYFEDNAHDLWTIKEKDGEIK